MIAKATESEIDFDLLDDVQKKLDLLAEKYQHNKRIGSAVYKLYDLQAFIHYFNGNDTDALDFINQAIDTRGNSYNRAERLKDEILKGDSSKGNSYAYTLPLQLQALIKGQRSSAIIMAIISVLTIWFIPLAIFYVILATKLKPNKVPNRGLIKAAAIVTLPLCFGLIPIIIDVEFWRMNKRLKEYQENGAKAFVSDKEWLVGEPKRKKNRRVAWSILISLVIIFAALIIVAVLNNA